LGALKLVKARGLDIPLIIVSGSIGEERAVAAMQQGAKDYVLKDRLARLGPAAMRAIQEKRLREEQAQVHKKQSRNEKLLAGILDNSAEAIICLDHNQQIVLFNKAAERLFGYSSAELIDKPLDPLLPDRLIEIHRKHVDRFAASPEMGRSISERQPLVAKRKDGTEFPVEISLSKVIEEGRVFFSALITDLTERQRAQDQVRRRADEFAALFETAQSLSVQQTELSSLLQSIVDRATALLRASSGTLSLYHSDSRDLELVAAHDFPAQLGMRTKFGEGIAGRVAQTREPMIVDDYSTFEGRLPKYENVPFRASLQVPMLFGGTLMGVIAVHEIGDSTRKYTDADSRLLALLASQAASAVNNARLFEETQLHLSRLQALHQIDIAISGSVDLRTSLGVFLDYATSELGVDSSDILLLNAHTQMLEFAVKRGFRTPALQYTNLRLGDGLAGKAALNRRTLSVPDLIRDIDGLGRSPFIQREGFVSYYGVPLIAKGKVNGVLEIFHRRRLDPGPEWLDFLETLAGQAAIAVDSAQMHGNLQRANVELSLAYDSTLEGWSSALDLRDRETEGHTQRVTEMTLRLAREMGVNESDLVHVRRGALLHDIGKMGIPDSILFKPGPLTDGEWQIMRQHPSYAFQLLSTITFLKPAIDIPYCHHEKWDGTGYPRG
jgi:PAS domain S-box-containing protein/putative nucleotidyltransferase with HDIG domain